MEPNFIPHENHKNIPGWGVDAEFSERPAIPYWKPVAGKTGAHWTTENLPQQEDFNDFTSIERPGASPTHVFGNASPPSGLSGLIRAWSFRYSEGSWAHWMGLLFADRVNVLEGVSEDLFSGHVPNVFKEMGLKSELKYNKKNFYRNSAIAGLIFIVLPVSLILLTRKKDQ
jgi:hypothetical protein